MPFTCKKIANEYGLEISNMEISQGMIPEYYEVKVYVSNAEALSNIDLLVLMDDMSLFRHNKLYSCDTIVAGDEVYYQSKLEKEKEEKNEVVSSSGNSYDSSGLSHEKKLEIMSYINGIMDPLNEDMSLSDEYLEEKANDVWAEAERIYGVTEQDIISIMMDYDLTREYYGTN